MLGLCRVLLENPFSGISIENNPRNGSKKEVFFIVPPTFMKSHFKTLRNNQIWQKKLEEKQQKPKIFDIRPITRLDWISIARL